MQKYKNTALGDGALGCYSISHPAYALCLPFCTMYFIMLMLLWFKLITWRLSRDNKEINNNTVNAKVTPCHFPVNVGLLFACIRANMWQCVILCRRNSFFAWLNTQECCFAYAAGSLSWRKFGYLQMDTVVWRYFITGSMFNSSWLSLENRLWSKSHVSVMWINYLLSLQDSRWKCCTSRSTGMEKDLELF